MSLDALIFKEPSKTFPERRERIIPRCDWYKIAQDPNSSTFGPAREGSNEINKLCLECTGYDPTCSKYQEQLRGDVGQP